jgi:uncharacterized protein (TIGR02246 family)
MIKHALGAAAAAAILLAGCAAKKEEAPAPAAAAEPPPPAVDLAAEEQAIRNRSGEWMNYMNAKDSGSLAGVYAPSAVSIYDGNVTNGAEAIHANIAKELADNPKAIFSWTSDAVHAAASGDLAYETGSISVDLDGADGKKPATTGSFVTVWEKVDGSWRVVADAGTENAKKP